MWPRHVNNTARGPPNPLRNRTPDEIEDDVSGFHERVKLEDVVDLETLTKGAFVAADSTNAKNIPGITATELQALEKRTPFQQSKDLKVTILTTACAAITQGWQQSTINSSSSGWKQALLRDDDPSYWNNNGLLLAGFIDAAPWLSASIIGTWLSDPLQEGNYGRRPALFISAVFCAACTLGSARCVTWEQLLVCRLLLGIGIGAKASIAPVFAAEAAVDNIRGQVLMMWQLFDTFGVFVGFACDWIVNRQWRVLLGTASVPALILLFLVFLCPESPRYLIRKKDYRRAYTSLRQLRGSDIEAARDLYYIHCQLQLETELLLGERPAHWYRKEIYQDQIQKTNFPGRLKALFVHPRNRRACLAAFLVMASQQLCGINVLSFYSTRLFKGATSLPDNNNPSEGFKVNPLEDSKVTWLNFGFGLANFLFTIPAYKYIDKLGRRILLLISLTGMFFSLLAIGFFFRITHEAAKLALVSTFSIGFFTFFYGIGAGPVPFTFSAEVFPLAFREVGMSFSVMVNFLGLGLLVLFVPKLTDALGKQYGESNLCFLFT
ncbi:hypothetical protein BDV25DRAFT_160939 [Aspergillus avenaceus]|uniref:Major facilitator superfamily (MFS) profile domain-containing protein n=1 Tax=Aspergillus avenaceus TaxID=36643 RepID=A0A5N6TLN5_ASPAV|nr:hypothetical protein BDV25DRAFT_160939 [Aspergillus avenaceus]